MFNDYWPVADVGDSIGFMAKIIGICSIVFPIAEQPIEIEWVMLGTVLLFCSLGFDFLRDWSIKRKINLIVNNRRTD